MVVNMATVQQVRLLAESLSEGTENLNNIVPLLEYCQDSQDEVVHAALHGAFRFFKPRVQDGSLKQLSSDKAQSKIQRWLREKYNTYIEILLSQLAHKEPGIQVPTINLLMKVVAAESEQLSLQDGQITFANDLFFKVVSALAHNPRLNEQLSGEFSEKYLNEFDDLRYYTLKNLTKVINLILEDPTASSPDAITSYEEVVERLFMLLTDIEMKTSQEELTSLFVGTEYPVSAQTSLAALKLPNHRKVFGDAWLHFLRLPLSYSVYKRVLVILYKDIYPHMSQPTLLMDFLSDSFHAGGVVSLLSLNSLFMLMTKHNLDYPNFYIQLYSLFDESVMYVKYRTRFFRMAELFLQSTHLPSYLVAAFIKRLARLSLNAPPAAILVNLVFVYNLLLRHHACLVLIHRSPVQAEKAHQPFDPFIDSEIDPAKCHALESSLWEIQLLKDHYDSSVARFAKTFEQVLRKAPFDSNDYLKQSYQTIFEGQTRKPIRHEPPLAFAADSTSTLEFNPFTLYSQLWNFNYSIE